MRAFAPLLAVLVVSVAARGAEPTGKGVILGFVEGGIDWRHPALCRETASGGLTTRILALWDQTCEDGAGTPPDEGYGCEWSREEIDRALAGAGDVAIDTGERTVETTVAALVAAGSGRYGRGTLGLAPEAELIVVSPKQSTAAIIDAVQYILRRVAAVEERTGTHRGLVIAISQGSHLGPHHRPGELNGMFARIAGPDRILLAAAGNARGFDVHASAPVPPGPRPLELPFEVPEGLPDDSQVVVLAIYPNGVDLAFAVETDGVSIAVEPGELVLGRETPRGRVSLHNAPRGAPPLSSTTEHEVLLVVDPEPGTAPAPGRWTLRATRRGGHGDSGRIDAWVVWPKPKLERPEVRFLDHVDESELVEWPASAPGVIAVAAYDGRTGALYERSSPGWTLPSGATKPEIAAPGVRVERVVRGQAGLGSWRIARVSGTSVAVPALAGAIARLLEASVMPLTPEGVLATLCATATADSLTGEVPNVDWGCGKLDPLLVRPRR